MRKGLGIFFVVLGGLFLIRSIFDPDFIKDGGIIQSLFLGGIGVLLMRSGNKKEKEKETEKETEKAIKDLKKKEIINSIEETLQKSKLDYEKMTLSELKDYKERTEKIIRELFLLGGNNSRSEFDVELVKQYAINSKSNFAHIGENIEKSYNIQFRIDDIEDDYQTNEIQFRNKAIDKDDYKKNKLSLKRKYYSPKSSVVKISEKLYSLNIITEKELNVTKDQREVIKNKEKQQLISNIFSQYDILEKAKKEIDWLKY